jgi:hypothetical protein
MKVSGSCRLSSGRVCCCFGFLVRGTCGSCDKVVYIYIFLRVSNLFLYIKVLMRKSGGPQALPGGAKPDPQGVYPPKGLSLRK